MSLKRIDRRRDRRRAALERMAMNSYADSRAKRLGTATEDQWYLARQRAAEHLVQLGV